MKYQIKELNGPVQIEGAIFEGEDKDRIMGDFRNYLDKMYEGEIPAGYTPCVFPMRPFSGVCRSGLAKDEAIEAEEAWRGIRLSFAANRTPRNGGFWRQKRDRKKPPELIRGYA